MQDRVRGVGRHLRRLVGPLVAREAEGVAVQGRQGAVVAGLFLEQRAGGETDDSPDGSKGRREPAERRGQHRRRARKRSLSSRRGRPGPERRSRHGAKRAAAGRQAKIGERVAGAEPHRLADGRPDAGRAENLAERAAERVPEDRLELLKVAEHPVDDDLDRLLEQRVIDRLAKGLLGVVANAVPG